MQLQACLKEIHTNMLHKHLERLEKPFEGEDMMMELSSRLDGEDSDQDANGIDYAKFCIWLFRYSQLMVITCIDAESLSPEPILNEEVQEEEAAEGSNSPQLLRGDEEEEAFDPEEDRALLMKCMAVIEERCVQEFASRPSPEDNFEKEA
ncbi:Cactin [Forsythia ovata]|uniref:Cactin n=1 Tax=Forsythia ovata TaxID=205694 RepID=A0ABD1S0N4_9LAMI